MLQDHGETVDNHRYRMDRAITVFEQLLTNSTDRSYDVYPDFGEPVRLAQIRAAVAGSFDVYSRLFMQTFDIYEDLVQQALVNPAEALPDTPLLLTGCRGESVEAPLWIHNTTDADVGSVSAWMTALTAHDGAEIPGCSGAVTPSNLEVPAGESRDTVLTVEVPIRAISGLYHGHVLVTGLPSTSLPVRLMVAM